jgi:Acetyltransferase (GNAT) family
MNIRKAISGDVHKLSHLWLALCNEISPGYTPNPSWWRESTLKALSNPDYSLLLAESSGKLLAYTDGCIIRESSLGMIIMFSRNSYVLPEFRGKDIMKSLYCMLTDIARKGNCQKLMFLCNDTTLSMWKGYGYKPIEHVMLGDLHDIGG